jgi:tRNA-splicing endonuclease subunit Sen2
MAAAVEHPAPEPSPQDAPPVDSSSAPLKNKRPKAPYVKRPNYAQIHARPLPVEVFPLPAFLPHNPLSIVRIAIALLSHSIWPPTSTATVHKAYFSTETHSIHVTDPKSMRALWEHGFWGAGSLSRSEPAWLAQEKRRRGIEASQTSEEHTKKRREERRQFKLERAKVQRETIEQQLRDEGKLDVLAALEDEEPSSTLVAADDLADDLADLADGEPVNVGVLEAVVEGSGLLETDINLQEATGDILDQEHLQLTPEEAFFLTYSLGAVQIYRDKTLLSTSYLFRLYCIYSTFPIVEDADTHLYTLFRLRERLPSFSLGASEISPIASDSPFLLRYAVYHHFRSLGWVVRHGIKFACDFLLYQRGPVFAHAKFAVVIVPSYSHPYWSETPERKAETQLKESRDWWWLHRVNRVETQVHKTLMLVYVEVPPPWDEGFRRRGFEVDVGGVLKKYKVREFIIRRWTPNRNRD